ncbi:MAG: M23 family metallopeptidase [Flavobacteriaceae bacterium]|jgi:murein DD-endopeptidase MepM/ murein hydrolase activator NlpD|nr:M23 family metallopeptidase [Flavobacteriaceae bacterium]MDG2314722.1 M23 family metallopeptidase [Flavobacteriaceae bacterium]
MAKKSNKPKLRQKLLNKYRFVVLNEDTFEERLSYKLSRLNIFILMSLFGAILIGSTVVTIAFTPIKEYLPGYDSIEIKRQSARNITKMDSLEHALFEQQQFLSSITKVLTGDLEVKNLEKDTFTEINRDAITGLELAPNLQDSLLRAAVAQEDKFNILESASSVVSFVLFPPVTGVISQPYDVSQKHYAVDIAVAQNAPIKAVSDGTVIFAEWTLETGYVVILEHQNTLLSVYKHNATITVLQGDLVKSGEVIATAGNTGEFSTGPHLHFELWSNGYPVNPVEFIDFE